MFSCQIFTEKNEMLSRFKSITLRFEKKSVPKFCRTKFVSCCVCLTCLLQPWSVCVEVVDPNTDSRDSLGHLE